MPCDVTSATSRRPQLLLRRPRPFVPHWSGECEGYAHNTLRRFWPALQPWYEWDDLMQESFLVFLKCKRRYYATVDRPQWFMALFKISLRNRLINLVLSVPRYSLVEGDAEVPDFPVQDVVLELWEVVRDLPRELQMVLMDVCRLQPRFNFSKQAVRDLRAALAG